MNAVYLWVFLPLALAGGMLLFAGGKHRTTLAAGVSAALALAALLLPIEQPLRGTLRLSATWEFLGRSISLSDAARPWLAWLYFGLFLWLLGARWLRTPPALPAAALGSAALWVASLSISPFIYAPGLLFAGLLFWLPVLARQRGPQTRAVLRLLNLQFLAVPALLSIGWMLSSVETLPAQQTLALRVGVLMAVGLALLLGVFPFHVWYPSLVAETHPYAAGMLLYFLPQVGMRLGLTFLEQYAWLRNTPQVQFFLLAGGALMLVAGGLLAVLERHLGRVWGYLLLADVGACLLAASLFLQQGMRLFFAGALPHLLAVFTGTLGVALLADLRGSLRFSALAGSAYQSPLAAAALLCGVFSLSGFPLLAGFPVRLALWEALPPLPLALGMLGILGVGIRLIAILVGEAQPSERQILPLGLVILLMAGIVLLFLTGLFPALFLPLMRPLENLFPHLVVL